MTNEVSGVVIVKGLIYFRVMLFPSSFLVNVSRCNGRNSRSHQNDSRDSMMLICSPEERSRWNGAMRRPTAPASNTIHLKGGLLRSIPAFLMFPPPLVMST